MGTSMAGMAGRFFLVGVIVSAVGFAASPAHASGSVVIGKVPTQTAAYKKKVTITPVATAKGNARVLSTTVTVKAKSKTLVRSAKRAKLKAGTYTLTTQVRYQTYRWVTRAEVLRPQGATLVPSPGDAVGFGECTVTDVTDQTDFQASCGLVGAREKSIEVSASDLVGNFGDVSVSQAIWPQEITLPRAIHRSVTSRVYSKARVVQRRQTLKVKQGPKPASCATPARMKKVKKGMTVGQVKVLLGKSTVQAKAGDLVNREYKPCQRKYYMIVTFENGKVFEKSVYKL